MITLLIIICGVLLLVVGHWAWKQSFPDESFEESLIRLGLKEYNDRLLAEIAAKERPVQQAAVTHRMKMILEELESARSHTEAVAAVSPQDELDAFACEELVALGRLSKTPDGRFTAIIRPR